MSAQVGTQLIRGISGGERKRTSIGMELIIDPSVLFLDEPTTGLDASTAYSVLLLLKRSVYSYTFVKLSSRWLSFSIHLSIQKYKCCFNISALCVFVFRMASQGHTIIMSIHQPRYSIYRLFDSLTLLANGKQVYHGPAQDALGYFANIGRIIYRYND